MLNIKRIDSDFFNTSTYLLSENYSDDLVLVDCGSFEDVMCAISTGQKVTAVLLTHTHFDHIAGLNQLLSVFPDVKVYTNDYGMKALSDDRLNMSRFNESPFTYLGENVYSLEGIDKINLAGIDIDVIPTPGHAPSCLSYRIGESLFTGDSYIPGLKVVTTFPKSNKEAALQSEERLKEMEENGLEVMAGHVAILPRRHESHGSRILSRTESGRMYA